MQSRHVYWMLKVLTFLTPFCKTFLLTNTRNSQKISNYKIKIYFRVNFIAFKKKKDYTNYEGKLTVWFLICQERCV